MTHRATILAVEHTPLVRSGIAAVLEDAYNDVVECTSVEAAIDLLKVVRVDLIVAELELPESNGIELTRRVRSDPSSRAIPVVLLACTTAASVQRAAMDAGAAACLRRPVTRERLREIVDRIMQQSSAGGRAGAPAVTLTAD